MDKGLYLGPLRLLAAEVYDNLTSQGVYTNLLTGKYSYKWWKGKVCFCDVLVFCVHWIHPLLLSIYQNLKSTLNFCWARKNTESPFYLCIRRHFSHSNWKSLFLYINLTIILNWHYYRSRQAKCSICHTHGCNGRNGAYNQWRIWCSSHWWNTNDSGPVSWFCMDTSFDGYTMQGNTRMWWYVEILFWLLPAGAVSKNSNVNNWVSLFHGYRLM